MSVIDKILAPFKPSAKASAAARAVAYVYNVGSPVFPERDFRKGAKAGFENNVTVYACVMEIARAVASIKWEVKLVGQDWSEMDAPPTHPLVKLLKKPNEHQGAGAFFEMECAYYMLSGNSFMEGTSAGDTNQPSTKPPTELHILRPDRMNIVPSSLGGISYYEHKAGSAIQKFNTTRVLHRRSFSPLSDWYGFAPLTAASRAITADNSAQEWNVSLLQNSGRPSGMIVSKGSLTDEQFNRIQTEVADKYQGPNNAGRVMVADGEDGLEWIEMSKTPKELEWLEGRKLSRAEICQAFQVPPELIGDTANKTYSNFQEARRSFWIETILPYVDRLRDDLNIWLAPRYGENVCIEYDKSEIDALQEDVDKLWTRAGVAVKDGRITPNEARALMGYQASEDDSADERLVQGSLIPAGDVAPAGEPTDIPDDTEDEKHFETMSTKGDSKPALWKKIEASRKAWERRIVIAADKELASNERAVIKAIKNSDHANVQRSAENAMETQRKSWEAFFESLYMTVGKDFARGTGKSVTTWETKLDDEVTRIMRIYIEKVAAKKVVEVVSTSLKSIRRAIQAGLDEGEGMDLIAKRVAASTAFSEFRSRAIARTEVVAASNYGSIAGMKSTGLELYKVWVATIDERTRGIAPSEYDHFAADEQKVGIDESFNVSGEALDFPADSSHGASAGNVINCRCAVTFQRVADPSNLDDLIGNNDE